MKGVLTFADSRPSEYSLFVVRQPDIPAPERDIEEIIIPGRNGSLTIDNKRYNNIEIAIDFNYIGKVEKWAKKWREIKKWLSAKNAKLSFDDDADFFYRVKYVKLSENQRKTARIGYFTATFICEPYMFLSDGAIESKQTLNRTYLCTTAGEKLLLHTGEKILSQVRRATIRNRYDTCKPAYRIVGKGQCALSVNHNNFMLALEDELIIDTEREVIYSNEKRLNTSICVNYEDLSLIQGVNIIECSGECDVYITPNWREL